MVINTYCSYILYNCMREQIESFVASGGEIERWVNGAVWKKKKNVKKGFTPQDCRHRNKDANINTRLCKMSNIYIYIYRSANVMYVTFHLEG